MPIVPQSDVVKMIGACIYSAFDQATANFRQNPNAEHWMKLEDAMHAHQHWCLNADKPALADELADCTLGTLVERIAAKQKALFAHTVR